ncbi:MAG: discoidin domain-containing protein [PVC group bacterium]
MLHSIPDQSRAGGRKFYIHIFAAVLVYIGFFVFSYQYLLVRAQLGLQHYPDAVRNGVNLVPEDFIRTFDKWLFQFGLSRARHISDIVELLDIKFRIWLFNHIIPHPTLSLAWLFSLVLSPFLLFKLVNNMTQSRTAAWVGVSLYCASSGFLYPITLYEQPAKQLTNFFVICCLYIASRITVSLKKKDDLTAKDLTTYLVLLGVMFLAFFTDETAWFVYVCIPILFPSLFLAKRRKWFFIGPYLMFLICFLLAVTYLVPHIADHYGFDKFDFWEPLQKSHPYYGGYVSPARWLSYSARTGAGLFKSQLAPWGADWSVIHIAVLGYFIFLLTVMPAFKKRLMIRALIVMALFILFQSRINLTVSNTPLVEPFYYNGLFSLFLVFPLSILLLPLNQRKVFDYSSKALFALLVAMLAYNFFKINAFFLQDERDGERGYSYSMVSRAWRNRDDKEALARLRPLYPPASAWMFFGWSTRDGLDQYVEKRITDSPNLPEGTEAVVTASSYNLLYEGAEALFDGDPDTFWQPTLTIMLRPTWLIIDFGEEKLKKIRTIAARPRRNHSDKFFRNAAIFGGQNGESWELIAPILQEAPPPTNDWLQWSFPNDKAYRFYKLEIYDGNNRGRNFNSIAELLLME